ncbi:NUDIX domain-containing protein [Pandoraea vervacti]|uniref:NUDIX domain-containing protein n=1 Tax=Pandoraea vervacti TaxID=656178 RepID=UPI0009345E96|nr:NUDIX domain-containing protein [Pandoraea vervacti]
MNYFSRTLDRLDNLAKRLLRAKTVGVRALILDKSNRVLLVKHTYRNGWHTPGGGVNSGETLVEAIRREVYEETKLRLSGEIQLFNIYLNKWKNLDDFPVLFIARDYLGNAEVGDPAEIAEIGWFSFDRLPMETTEKTRQRILEFRGLREKSDRW